jgi:D-mannonate dehydratase
MTIQERHVHKIYNQLNAYTGVIKANYNFFQLTDIARERVRRNGYAYSRSKEYRNKIVEEYKKKEEQFIEYNKIQKTKTAAKSNSEERILLNLIKTADLQDTEKLKLVNKLIKLLKNQK